MTYTKAQKVALLKLAEAVLACEEADIQIVALLDDHGRPAMSLRTVAAPRALVERLWDGRDHGSQDYLNYAAVELALRHGGVEL